MLSKVGYGALLIYCNKLDSQIYKSSKEAQGAIKKADTKFVEYASNRIKEIKCFDDILNANTVLVPTPSSQIYSEKTFWTTKHICDIMVSQGLGKETKCYVKRAKTIRRSSHCSSANERPSVLEHTSTMIHTGEMYPPNSITIIDDVLSLGRTTYATASLVNTLFPEADINIFAFMRTRNFEGYKEFTSVLNPERGFIRYNQGNGKTSFTN